MPKFGPISRRNLIKFLKELGFEGPESGSKHQFMTKGDIHVILPNPHEGDISVGLLNRILKSSLIDRKDWKNL